MKLKNKIIGLTVCLSFCLVALFNVVYFKNNINTHATIMNKTETDYMSLLNEFDEKEIVVEEDKVNLHATQYLDEDFFAELDNVSYDESMIKNTYIDYSFDYVNEGNVVVVTIDYYENNNLISTETMEGLAFINERGEKDAIFEDDGEIIYLSDLNNSYEIENCGLFSKIKKAIKKTVTAVTQVAATATVYLAAAAVVCGVAAVSVVAAAYSGGTTAPVGVAATLATAAATFGAAAKVSAAITAAGAATAITIEVAEEISERQNDAETTQTNDDEKDVKEIPTLNDHLEGKTHPKTGVPYERDTTKNKDGETVSGVFPNFDSAFDTKLDENSYNNTREQHNRECNEKLKEAVEKDPELRAKFTEEQLEDIANGRTPDGYTWHHNQQPGEMQLVDENVHSQTGHTGGYSIWGRGN